MRERSPRPSEWTIDANTTAPSKPHEPDAVDAHFGIVLERLEPGFARISAVVNERMLNRYGACHGGVLFTIADAALGLASNSHGVLAVASGSDVNFLRPARLGDHLVAETREQNRTRRTALYHTEVRNRETGELVAVVSGRIAYPRTT